MPRAYLLAVASGSAVDRDTPNVSLFHLVEQVELPELPPHLRLQLELHAYWEAAPEELGVEFGVHRAKSPRIHAALLARTAPAGDGGAAELYKTSDRYDATSHNPEWIE